MSERIDQIAQGVAELKQAVQDTLKSESEKREEFEKRITDVMEAKRAEDRAKQVPDNAPLDHKTDEAASALFKGKMRLPYQKALQLSVDNPAIRGTAAAEQLKDLQDLHDACAFKFAVWRSKDDTSTARERMRNDIDFKMYMLARQRAGYHEKVDEILNPLSGATGGVNLDFTLLSAQLLDLVRLELTLASQFRQVTLTRPNQSFPALRSDSMAVWGTGATNPPVQDTISALVVPASPAHFSNPTFGQVTFNAQHCMGYSQLNDDMIEDSVVPILPVLREQMARSIARAIDRSILDGDNVSTHQDTDVAAAAANDFRKAINGLRNMTRTNVTAAGGAGAITPAKMHALRKKMGIYGRNPREVFYVLGMDSYYQLIVDTAFMTYDKAGPQFTNRTGVIDTFAGSDIVLSEFVRTDLNASGVNAATLSTFTVAYAANRTRFMFATYGTTQIESTRWAPLLYTIVQSDVRVDFEPIEALSSGEFAGPTAPAALLVNLTSA